MLRPLRQRSDLYREKPLATAWTIEGVKEALAAKKISARELLADFYRRIEARNPELNAYLALTPERARRQAERIDALVAAGGPLPPLAGVPMAIKDVISTRGTKTTCGSKILENYIPPYDATAVERLEAAGAVLLGKTNCDEFAMGSSNENSAYGPVKNPLAPDRVPGGSSGGSASPKSTSPKAWTLMSAKKSRQASRCSGNSAANWSTSVCRIPTLPSRPITSSPRPKRVPTWHATTAYATASACPTIPFSPCIARRSAPASGPK